MNIMIRNAIRLSASLLIGVASAVAVAMPGHHSSNQSMMEGKPACMMMPSGSEQQPHGMGSSEKMSEMQQLKKRMHELLASDRPNPDEVRALHDRMSALHGDMLVDCVKRQGQSAEETPDPVQSSPEDHSSHH